MLTDKMKEVLSPEDQVKLETAINSLINQKSIERSDLMIEEKSKELKTEFEAEYAKKLDEAVVAEKAKLAEQKENDLEEMEKNLVEKLNTFLDLQISEKISDEAIEKIALNETLKPLVEGIKSLFEEKFIELDTEGHGILKEAKEEIEALTDKVSEQISEKMELKEKLDKLETELLISSKTKELTESQFAKVKSFFSDKNLSETQKKLDSFIEMIVEKEEAEDKSEKAKDLKENTDVTSSEDGLPEPDATVVLESKNVEEKNSNVTKANTLL